MHYLYDNSTLAIHVLKKLNFFKRVWSDVLSNWPLNLDFRTTWTTYSLSYMVTNISSSMSVKQRNKKSIKWTSLSTFNVQSSSSMTFDFWPHDLKINRDHILFNGHLCTKFDVCPLTCSKGIDLTTLNPMVNVQSLNLGLSKT